jgi:NifU-like protein involved in Fe-S cluster formation
MMSVRLKIYIIYIYFSKPNPFREDEKVYTPHQSHDLESFVKTFYLLNNLEDIELLRNDADFDTRIKCAHEYWHNFENKADSFWKEALEIARSDMIENYIII